MFRAIYILYKNIKREREIVMIERDEGVTERMFFST